MSVDYRPDYDPADVDHDYGHTGGEITVPTFTGDTRPFRFWCQKALPLVYDDSLSYYEVLCKMADYMNNFMTDLTTVEDSMTEFGQQFVLNQQFLNSMADQLGQNVADLEAYINDRMTDFMGAYTQLQTYVNTYFDNLDVQQEINSKLDDMASDGTLNDLFDPVLETWMQQKTAQIDNAISNQNAIQAEQNARISVLEGRMDTFEGLPAGSTAGNAELVGIRTNFLGETYPTAGDAVRASDMIASGFVSIPITRLEEWNGNSASSTYDTIQFDVSAYKGGHVVMIANMESFVQTAESVGIGVVATNVSGKTEDQNAREYALGSNLFPSYSVIPTQIAGEERILLFFSIPDDFSYQYLKMGYVEEIPNGDYTQPAAIVYANSWSKTQVDPTLTIAGDAADAKAAGDAISELNERIGDVDEGLNNTITPVMTTGYGINNQGTTTASALLDCSDFLPVIPNTGIRLKNVDSGTDFGCCWYDINKTFVSKYTTTTGIGITIETTVPNDVYYIRITSRTGVQPTLSCIDLYNGYIKPTYYDVQSIKGSLGNVVTPTMTTGYAIGNDGEPFVNALCDCSSYIPVYPLTTIHMVNVDSGSSLGCCFYDSSRTFLSKYTDTTGVGVDIKTTVPSNAYYLRVTTRSGVTPYIEYCELVDKYIAPALTNSRENKKYIENSKIQNYFQLVAGTSDLNQELAISAIDGETIPGTVSWSHTDYIDVNNYKHLYVTQATFGSSNNAGLAFYDESYEYVSGINGRATGTSGYETVLIDIPNNAKYASFSFRTNDSSYFLVYADEIQVIEEQLETSDNSNSYGMQLFQKIGVISDSISVGWAKDKDGNNSRRNTGISWVQQMARRLGCTAYNLGASGVDPIEWFQNDFEFAEYCYTQYQSVGACDLYIIGLGLNQGTLGSASDINQSDYTQNGETFYGQYARIIQMINDEHPDAIIMCLTEPTPRIASYDQAIRNICALSFINAELVDLEKDYFYLFNTPEILAEHQPDELHFTPYGYSLIAEAMVTALNDYISKHSSAFKYVGVAEVS